MDYFLKWPGGYPNFFLNTAEKWVGYI